MKWDSILMIFLLVENGSLRKFYYDILGDTNEDMVTFSLVVLEILKLFGYGYTLNF